MRLAYCASLLVCIFSLPVRGALYQSVTYTSGFANNGVVPDANPNGWQDTRIISGFVNTAQNLYAYLYHAGTMVVLLNRLGATAANPYGYLTSGMNITFDGSAAIDIHLYGGGANVTGTYQPDQRNSNPRPRSTPARVDLGWTRLRDSTRTDPGRSFSATCRAAASRKFNCLGSTSRQHPNPPR